MLSSSGDRMAGLPPSTANMPDNMKKPLYPSLYQINTRVWLAESHALRRPATLDDIADSELDHLAAMGFDWIWLLSVWQTGEAGQRISRANPEFRREFRETLPDLREEDIAGSGFAITSYTVHRQLGAMMRCSVCASVSTSAASD